MHRLKPFHMAALTLLALVLLPPAFDRLIGFSLEVGALTYATHIVVHVLGGMLVLWGVALRKNRRLRDILIVGAISGVLCGLADMLLGAEASSPAGTLHTLLPKLLGGVLLVTLLQCWGAWRANSRINPV